MPRLFVLSVLLLASCQCPEATDLRRLAGFSLATPEEALVYFREALLREDSQQQYLVFSETLKDAIPDELGVEFSLGNYLWVRDDVRAFIEERVGPIADIQVGDARYSSEQPYLARVPLLAHGQSQMVRLIQETSFRLRLTSGENISGHLPPGTNAASLKNAQLSLDFPVVPQLIPKDDELDIYRIDYYREWKILDLEGSSLSRALSDFLQKRAAEHEQQKQQKQPPPPDGT